MGNLWETHVFGPGLTAVIFLIMLVAKDVIVQALAKREILWLPPSLVCMLFGSLTAVTRVYTYPGEQTLIDPELFFFFILPPIIAEAAYSTHRKTFFMQAPVIFKFAVIGTFLSSCLVGVSIYGYESLGWVPGLQGITLTECVIFGAILSCVDPVATLSIMGHPAVNADQLTYSLIFGESVLNDAVCVVLFRSLTRFTQSDESTRSLLLEAIGFFCVVAVASTLMGMGMGILGSLLLKHTALQLSNPTAETLAVFVVTFLSYAVAEMTAMSGITSLFFCAIVLSHFNHFNLSHASKEQVEGVFGTLGHMAEDLVYIYLGYIFIWATEDNWVRAFQWDWTLITLAICTCVLVRTMNILLISRWCNRGGYINITWNMQVMLIFGGLRGAVGFTLSLLWANERYADLVLTTMLVLTLLTSILGGLFTEKLVTALGLKKTAALRDSPLDPVLTDHLLTVSVDHLTVPGIADTQGVMDLTGSLNQPEHKRDPTYLWFARLERRFRPMFTNPQKQPSHNNAHKNADNSREAISVTW